MSVLAGYERLQITPHPEAVRWWYWETREGYVFARGGRVATSRLARRAIAQAQHESRRERESHEFAHGVQHATLNDDGSLTYHDLAQRTMLRA